jgi:hypothetical protein
MSRWATAVYLDAPAPVDHPDSTPVVVLPAA